MLYRLYLNFDERKDVLPSTAMLGNESFTIGFLRKTTEVIFQDTTKWENSPNFGMSLEG